MREGRWHEARALFDEALQLPDGERIAFVESRAAADPELLAEVTSLLESHAGAKGFLDGTEIGLLGQIGVADAAEIVRERIGPWRIVSVLGRGGMGVVYLGERDLGDFEQRVAIKVVSGAFESSAIVERFRVERRILAALEHPGIARLLEGGTTADGLPYLVMEHVEGVGLLDWADQRRLDVRARLDLFLEVCAAVEHAHRRLVVHRDLKPSNILVTPEGRPKLLDFGIAKILESEESAAASGEPRVATATASAWMTPAYASPEQIRGETTTTATDTYSLGVVLFELLVGESPFPSRGRGSAADRLESAGRVASRPSTAWSRRHPNEPRAAHELRGDLDTIVLKALAAEPERRYGSVAELSDDLRRYLGGRPVRARPDTFAYRAAKFVRRHRVGVALTAAAAAAIVAGMTLALLGFVRAQRAEAAARADAATAEGVSEFLVNLFEVSDPGEARGNQVTARELLDRGATSIDRQLADQPVVRAKMLRAIGRAYGALGLFDAELSALSRELETRSAIDGAESPAVADTLSALAVAHLNRGAYQQARDLALRSLAIQRRAFGDEQVSVAKTLSQLGNARRHLGELPAARRDLERALAMHEKLLGREHVDLAGVLNNLAIVHWAQGDTQGARPFFDRALAISERAHGPDHPSVANTLNNLGILDEQAGDLPRARQRHERALAVRRKILAPDHPDIAESLNNLGNVLLRVGELEASRRAFTEALAIREKALSPDHFLLGSSLYNLGNLLLMLDEYAAARPLLERAEVIQAKALGADHFNVAFPLSGLAWVDYKTGNRERAEARFRRAIELMEKGLGAAHPDLRWIRQNFVEFLRAGGREAEAAEQERLAGAPPPAESK